MSENEGSGSFRGNGIPGSRNVGQEGKTNPRVPYPAGQLILMAIMLHSLEPSEGSY